MTDTLNTTEVRSTFQGRPCYRYIRRTDKLPVGRPPGENMDFLCPVKLFNPGGAGTWWIASYDPDDGVAWGVAEIHEREWGTIYIPELVKYRGAFGLPIERDLYYRPQTAAALMGFTS